MSGYDLKQVFDCSLAPLWNATHSQIYNELRRMLTLEWVEMERNEQESRPDKKVYQITPAGLVALEEWQLQQPVRGLQMRDEVLLRFIFGSFADPQGLTITLRAAIKDHEQRMELYKLTQQQLPPTPRRDRDVVVPVASGAPDPFFLELARFALMFEETYLQWLREALAFVEARIESQPHQTASSA
jgi:DNA-binding PadR family transcriptional regulator